MKRKQIAGLWLALLVMMVSISAFAQEAQTTFAETTAPTANATIIAPEVTHVTAPFSGTLLPFTWKAGDVVQSGDELFDFRTTKIYAPEDGKLTAMFVAQGQDASGAMARYGAACTIEAANPFYVEASTSKAYDHNDNKFVHTGEMLYLKAGDVKGTGRITNVVKHDYTVEVLTGDFEFGETITCYRESGYARDSVIGTGKLRRYDDALVNAFGRVFAVHKKEGDNVREGDLLLEMIDAASDPNTNSTHVVSLIKGAITAMHTLSGAQVYQGQLLCEIVDLTRLELSVQVDELYLSTIAVGDILSFTLDAFAGQEFKGTVTKLLPIGENRQNAAYYDVRLSIPEATGVLPGMNGTVYLSNAK